MELDRQNVNPMWMNALCKEMNGVSIVAFVDPGYKKIPGFIIWDVKMDFTCKVCMLLADIRRNLPKF
jgi:hypothetical protein